MKQGFHTPSLYCYENGLEYPINEGYNYCGMCGRELNAIKLYLATETMGNVPFIYDPRGEELSCFIFNEKIETMKILSQQCVKAAGTGYSAKVSKFEGRYNLSLRRSSLSTDNFSHERLIDDVIKKINLSNAEEERKEMKQGFKFGEVAFITIIILAVLLVIAFTT